jgi:hypothetical protein
MSRPPLREIPLGEAVPLRDGEVTVTMSVGQWDRLLAGAYDAGFLLLELDAEQRPVRAFRRAAES